MTKARTQPHKGKLIFASVAFLGILGAGLGLAVLQLRGPGFSRGLLQFFSDPRKADTQATVDPVFYTELGQTPSETTATNGPAQFTIEIAKVETQSAAEEWVQRLTALGIDGYYTPLHSHGKVFYRVRAGVFQQEGEAMEMAKNLQDQHHISGEARKL